LVFAAGDAGQPPKPSASRPRGLQVARPTVRWPAATARRFDAVAAPPFPSPRIKPVIPKKNRGRPTRDQASRLTEHLVSVASELFKEEGYSAVSMNRIAATAGIGKDTLYSRFSNKEALFFAVIGRQVKQHRSTCPALEESELPLAEALRQYGHWLVQASSSPGAISRTLLFYREGQRFDELGRIFQESYGLMFLAPIEKYFLVQQQRRGVFAGVAPVKLAKLFCDMVLSELNNRLIIRHDLPDHDEIEAHIAVVVQIFTRGAG
jgi:AcrR family transcriptional regulator